MTPVDPIALLSMLRAQGPVSASTLAARLGCTPRAIEAAVARLEALGVMVAQGPGPGYRLVELPEPLNEAGVRGRLDARTNGQVPVLEVLSLVDSTNRYLAASVARGAAPGTVAIAECQTGGQGRRGRRWVSPFGQNVYLSLYTGPLNRPAGERGGFPLLVGLGIVQALARLGPAGLCLKWPNDLMWDDAKLGGILIETTAQGEGGMIVGVGINVGFSGPMSAAVDQRWSSLERVTGGADLSRAQVAAAVIEGVLEATRRLEASGLAGLRRDWAGYDGALGRRVQVHVCGEVVPGIARGVDAGGRLIVDTGRARRIFDAGDVSLRWRS